MYVCMYVCLMAIVVLGSMVNLLSGGPFGFGWHQWKPDLARLSSGGGGLVCS